MTIMVRRMAGIIACESLMTQMAFVFSMLLMVCIPPTSYGKNADQNEKLLKSCVTITGSSMAGSGFFYSRDEKLYVATCKHVVFDQPLLTIKDVRGHNYLGSSIFYAQDRDIAFVEITNVNFREVACLSLRRNVEETPLKSAIMCMGNSQGSGVIVPAKGRLLAIGPTEIEIEADVVPGNSGSPVVSEKSLEVLGLADSLLYMSKDFWARGTRYENSIRRFAARIDNLDWNSIVRRETELISPQDMADLDKMVQRALYFRSKAKPNGEQDHWAKMAEGCLSFAESKGSAKALYYRAFWFIHDPKEKWLKIKQAAELGCPEAMMFTADMYANSNAYATSLYWLKNAATAGHVKAMIKLGISYEEGTLGQKDIERALEYYELASQAGAAEAKYRMALLYEKGKHVIRDKQKALQLLAEASADCCDASYHLAELCEGGGIAKRNERLMAKYYLLAAEHNHVNAMQRIAYCYENGIGVVKDKDKAKYWKKRYEDMNDTNNWILEQLNRGL